MASGFGWPGLPSGLPPSPATGPQTGWGETRRTFIRPSCLSVFCPVSSRSHRINTVTLVDAVGLFRVRRPRFPRETDNILELKEKCVCGYCVVAAVVVVVVVVVVVAVVVADRCILLIMLTDACQCSQYKTPLNKNQIFIVQELCERRGGRPGLSVLTSLIVSVDVKLH